VQLKVNGQRHADHVKPGTDVGARTWGFDDEGLRGHGYQYYIPGQLPESRSLRCRILLVLPVGMPNTCLNRKWASPKKVTAILPENKIGFAKLYR
jgi:hypothetical protein